MKVWNLSLFTEIFISISGPVAWNLGNEERRPVTPPLWIFNRRRDIEIEVGLVLAGTLVFDWPDDKKLSGKARRQIRQVIGTLTWLARSGQLPDYAVAGGWADKPPPDANEFLDNDIEVGKWAASRYDIVVRVAPRGSGKPRIDSDLLRQMGIMPTLQ